MSYCRFSSDGWRSDVYVYFSVGDFYQCYIAGRRHTGLDTLSPETLPDPREVNVDTGEWRERIQQFVEAHRTNMKLLDTLPLEVIAHGLESSHTTGTAGEMADWLEQVARPAGLHVPQYAIDELREDAKTERNYE